VPQKERANLYDAGLLAEPSASPCSAIWDEMEWGEEKGDRSHFQTAAVTKEKRAREGNGAVPLTFVAAECPDSRVTGEYSVMD